MSASQYLVRDGYGVGVFGNRGIVIVKFQGQSGNRVFMGGSGLARFRGPQLPLPGVAVRP